jgi:transposase
VSRLTARAVEKRCDAETKWPPAAALSQSLSGLKGFAVELKALSQRLDKLLARIDARIKALIEANAERKQHYARLRRIAGVAPVVGGSLINTLDRLPFKSGDAFVAFTGLDPRSDESGHRIGRRHLSKRGPGELRRLLYLAAMVQLRPRPGSPSTSTIGQRPSPQPQPWSSSRVASRAPPGQSIPTRPNSDPKRLTKALT